MDTEQLGTQLASKLRWDGTAILRVAEAALTDANFHTEAVIIRDLISKL
jgi:hypothetical protein